MNLPIASLPDATPSWFLLVAVIAVLLFITGVAIAALTNSKHSKRWVFSGFAVLLLTVLSTLPYENAHKEAWEQAAHDTDQTIAKTYELPGFSTTREVLFGTKQGALVCTEPLDRPVAHPASWEGGQGSAILTPVENGCAVTVLDAAGHPIQAVPSP